MGSTNETHLARAFPAEADYNRLYRYVLSLVHDAHEAEDLTQETFLRAHLPSASPLSKTIHWSHNCISHSAGRRSRWR